MCIRDRHDYVCKRPRERDEDFLRRVFNDVPLQPERHSERHDDDGPDAHLQKQCGEQVEQLVNRHDGICHQERLQRAHEIRERCV